MASRWIRLELIAAWTSVLAPDALEDFAPAIKAAEGALQKNAADRQYQRTFWGSALPGRSGGPCNRTVFQNQ